MRRMVIYLNFNNCVPNRKSKLTTIVRSRPERTTRRVVTLPDIACGTIAGAFLNAVPIRATRP